MMALVGAASAVAQATTDADAATAGEENLTVETEWADALGETEYIFGGNVTSFGDADAAYAWFEYREAGTDDWRVTPSVRLNGTGDYVERAAELAPNTTYEYRAAAADAEQSSSVRGEIETFETLNDPPAVTTGTAAKIDDSAATLNATATDLGGAKGATVSFAYREAGAEEWTRTDGVRVADAGPVTERVDGLSTETSYEYVATIEAADGQTETGERRTFATTAPLTAATLEPTDVDETVATLRGDYEGGNDHVEFAFEYRRQGADGWKTVDAEWGSSGFAATLTSLEPDADYEYRAVASAPNHGTATGDVRTFATDALPSVSTGDASSIGERSATVDAELIDLGGAASATVAVEYRERGTDAWESVAAENRTAPGTVAVDLDGLRDGTEYEYRAVAAASDGDAATGASATFSTETAERPPTVDSLRAAENSPPNPHAELSVDWAVSDADGDLERTTVTIHDRRGQVVERRTADSAGATDTGDAAATVKHGAGERYAVAITVTDADGRTTTERTTVWG